MIDQIYNFILHQLSTNQFFSAAALSSILLSAMYTLKGLPYRVWARVHRYIYFSVTVDSSDTLIRYIDKWLSKRYHNSLRLVEAAIDNSTGEISLSHNNDYIYIWRNRRRIRIGKSKVRLENASAASEAYTKSYVISGYLAKNQIKDLINEVHKEGKEWDESHKLERKGIETYYSTDYGGWKRLRNVPHKTFDQLYFEGKEDIIKDLDLFKENKNKLLDLGVVYKRGYLLHGSPGNGKSSLAFAMAHYLKYDLYFMDLGSMDTNSFSSAIKDVPVNSLIVIEDIDAFFDGRKSVNKTKLNFSSFINALSGVAQKDNVITVITTNKIKSIDPALKRKGRCDLVIEIKKPSKDIIEKYLSKVYNKEITLSREIDISFANLQGIVVDNLSDSENCIKTLYEYKKDEVQEYRDGDIQIEVGEDGSGSTIIV